MPGTETVHAFGMDDNDLALSLQNPVPNAVPGEGHFNRVQLGHSCRGPTPWTVGLRFLDGEHTELDMQEALRERRASWSSATLNLSLRGGWRIPTVTGNAARPL